MAARFTSLTQGQAYEYSGLKNNLQIINEKDHPKTPHSHYRRPGSKIDLQKEMDFLQHQLNGLTRSNDIFYQVKKDEGTKGESKELDKKQR